MEKESLRGQELVQTPQLIKVRCPECFKLYSVNSDEITEQKPKFACNSCQTKFWLAYPECLTQGEIIGFPLKWIKEPETSVNAAAQKEQVIEGAPEMQGIESVGFALDCPKCGESYKKGDVECRKCGVVFAKVQALQKDTVFAPKDIKSFWEQVIEHYDDKDMHQEFLRQCLKDDRLDYASSKYRQILEVQPSDEMALAMKNEIVALANVKIPEVSSVKKKRSKRRIPFMGLVIFLSTAAMVFGYFIPEMRNLVGLGASTLFLALAIKYYFLR